MRIFSSLVLLALLSSGLAQVAPSVQVSADVAPVYVQGRTGNVTLSVRLEDPGNTISDGVLFLNVVERDEARGWPQVAHRIFALAKETPTVFRQPYTGEALRRGVKTRLEFQLRSRAKPADYALVVQLYEGTGTNPNRVKPENRLGMTGFNFTITEP